MYINPKTIPGFALGALNGYDGGLPAVAAFVAIAQEHRNALYHGYIITKICYAVTTFLLTDNVPMVQNYGMEVVMAQAAYGMVEWVKMPRGTYRYSYDGLTADVWQVAGKGWLWAIYAGNDPLSAHEGIFQPTLDAACELAIKEMQAARVHCLQCGASYAAEWSGTTCSVCDGDIGQ